jgi:hypothetical protein
MPAANSNVIPEAARRLSEIHDHRPNNLARLAVVDSGRADLVRAAE